MTKGTASHFFCEDYPGSIVDVVQLQIMLEKVKSYGYKDVGFILDRGYFSEANLRFMNRNSFPFVIMVKGVKKLGNKSLRGYGEESVEAKICIKFVALVIRNKVHTSLRDAVLEDDKKANYMNVPAAIMNWKR